MPRIRKVAFSKPTIWSLEPGWISPALWCSTEWASDTVLFRLTHRHLDGAFIPFKNAGLLELHETTFVIIRLSSICLFIALAALLIPFGFSPVHL